MKYQPLKFGIMGKHMNRQQEVKYRCSFVFSAITLVSTIKCIILIKGGITKFDYMVYFQTFNACQMNISKKIVRLTVLMLLLLFYRLGR